MKEKLCYIPTANGTVPGEDEYELPDGNTVTLDSDCRSKAAEVRTRVLEIRCSKGRRNNGAHILTGVMLHCVRTAKPERNSAVGLQCATWSNSHRGEGYKHMALPPHCMDATSDDHNCSTCFSQRLFVFYNFITSVEPCNIDAISTQYPTAVAPVCILPSFHTNQTRPKHSTIVKYNIGLCL